MVNKIHWNIIAKEGLLYYSLLLRNRMHSPIISFRRQPHFNSVLWTLSEGIFISLKRDYEQWKLPKFLRPRAETILRAVKSAHRASSAQMGCGYCETVSWPGGVVHMKPSDANLFAALNMNWGARGGSNKKIRGGRAVMRCRHIAWRTSGGYTILWSFAAEENETRSCKGEMPLGCDSLQSHELQVLIHSCQQKTVQIKQTRLLFPLWGKSFLMYGAEMLFLL
jgi:hypothetical protein